MEFVLTLINKENILDLQKEIYDQDYLQLGEDSLYGEIQALLQNSLSQVEIRNFITRFISTDKFTQIKQDKENLRRELEEVFTGDLEDINQCSDRNCTNYYLRCYLDNTLYGSVTLYVSNKYPVLGMRYLAKTWPAIFASQLKRLPGLNEMVINYIEKFATQKGLATLFVDPFPKQKELLIKHYGFHQINTPLSGFLFDGEEEIFLKREL